MEKYGTVCGLQLFEIGSELQLLKYILLSFLLIKGGLVAISDHQKVCRAHADINHNQEGKSGKTEQGS